jgi:putative tricarboxylic transport membrane protein
MLGAMMVHGLQPGPLVMTKNADFIYGIFVALMLANIFCVILQYYGIRLFVRMLAVPKHILLPIIMVLSLVGAIAINNRIFDAWIVLVFGVLGIIMNKLDFPITPIILGFILGPLAETNLRRALMVSRGDLLPLVSNTPSMVLIGLSVLSLVLAPRLLTRGSKAEVNLEEEKA